MKTPIVTIWLALLTLFSFGQSGTITDTTASIYKNLETRKHYSLKLSATTSTTGAAEYKVDDNEVSKVTYEKYKKVWDNILTCKPCILETYDINEKKLWKSVQYEDCGVGFWIEYYPSGKVKVIGHYKENETGNWSDLWNRGYCCRKDGVWTHFDEDGNVTKIETYKEGKLN